MFLRSTDLDKLEKYNNLLLDDLEFIIHNSNQLRGTKTKSCIDKSLQTQYLFLFFEIGSRDDEFLGKVMTLLFKSAFNHDTPIKSSALSLGILTSMLC